jgi:hypothetical protein
MINFVLDCFGAFSSDEPVQSANLQRDFDADVFCLEGEAADYLAVQSSASHHIYKLHPALEKIAIIRCVMLIYMATPLNSFHYFRSRAIPHAFADWAAAASQTFL